MSINVKSDCGELVVHYKGKPLLVYSFGTNQFKPYVRELFTLEGENILQDAPPDHLHHHGLMYASWVNGINFWEEKEKPGIEKPIRIVSSGTTESKSGLPGAQWTQLIDWLGPSGETNSANASLLREERSLSITVDESNQEVALRWDSVFEVSPDVRKVTLHGSNYDGLGIRPALGLENGARFDNSEALPYAPNHAPNVTAARWTTLYGKTAGGSGEVLLALFGHPANRPGSGKFFSMTQPFVYLTASQGLDKEPLEYSAGQRFALRYLLTVCSTDKSKEFIEARYQKWLKEP